MYAPTADSVHVYLWVVIALQILSIKVVSLMQNKQPWNSVHYLDWVPTSSPCTSAANWSSAFTLIWARASNALAEGSGTFDSITSPKRSNATGIAQARLGSLRPVVTSSTHNFNRSRAHACIAPTGAGTINPDPS